MAPDVGLSTVKRFLDISAPLKMDPEVEYLIQQMHPVKGDRSGSLQILCGIMNFSGFSKINDK